MRYLIGVAAALALGSPLAAQLTPAVREGSQVLLGATKSCTEMGGLISIAVACRHKGIRGTVASVNGDTVVVRPETGDPIAWSPRSELPMEVLVARNSHALRNVLLFGA